MKYQHRIGATTYSFPDLKCVLAKATPERSGDKLAGLAAENNKERLAARHVLADTPLSQFLDELIIPYELDAVTRLAVDQLDEAALAEVRSLTVGEFRDWLLAAETDGATILRVSPGLLPEMVAAVSKLMSNQDLILAASKIRVVSQFRNTLGLKGHFSTRLQPNHPTDDPKGILASTIDGLLYGVGDAVIGINPASDDPRATRTLLEMLDELRTRFNIPTQTCVLAHVTTTIDLMEAGAPVDLIFQSIGGTEATNDSFGVTLELLDQAYQAGLQLDRGTVGRNCMYFETGQGSSHSANAHHGVDQQTCEVRAYAVARKYRPLLVNSVVGFIGPEYLYDGKQILRAGLEDHFCGKLMGLPMGCDVCYTNHAQVDQDDMDNLLSLLALAGCNFVMGVPGADDVMLHYQSTSYHDQLYLRQLLGLKHAPEFEQWLQGMNVIDDQGQILEETPRHRLMYL
ncbi:ethanolamine ammonia-lyase subunit EutB [Blastopirellula sp. JC732]|uniref:Ethanolamine ammonia-lyase large subunit n=1 Tax=Blastopirellula sediminis TaxID=2894196 RepID=A0A9X1MQB4_9BACT|nr:ethanolamine ammonia-lyase subunit EutB [Blastopirellula sediminis]MCC9607063.1 ethanolamine ammonia-lyase subunit EutB [Blastopirellula sediminis]MCC9629644.1 ethanolamine ammonia-lyase subunit EutB [Blastopirellula sediminis]